MLIPNRRNVNLAVNFGLQWLSKQYFQLLSDLQNCPLCLTLTVLPHPICVYCLNDLPWIVNACRQCGYPHERAIDSCEHCFDTQNVFSCFSALAYQDAVKWMFYRVKKHRDEPIARALSDILAIYLNQRRRHPIPDAIIPIPTTNRQRRRRGFNLPELLIQYLPANLKHLSRPILTSNTAHTEMKHLSRAQRMTTLDRFRVSVPSPRHVVIVDDVITTGATMASAIAALKANGAECIEVWSVARTPFAHSHEN